MAKGSYDYSGLVPSGMHYTVRAGHPQLKLNWPSFPSVEDLFGPGSNPERILSYPRYDAEPEVKCHQCHAKVKLSRVPFQNGCKDCKEMGWNMGA